ncbi:MAG: hypothetical protein LC101_01515 [Flavobacteriales bacterium]|nr:hypothetical protein [Flavobacteriales bacterium]
MKKLILSAAALFVGAIFMTSCNKAGCKTCSMDSANVKITVCANGDVETCVNGVCDTENDGETTQEAVDAWAVAMEGQGYSCN